MSAPPPNGARRRSRGLDMPSRRRKLRRTRARRRRKLTIAAFLLIAGSPVLGLLFPTTADPQATTLPAPPVVSYLGPIIPLLTIAAASPPAGYGVRYASGAGVNSGYSCTSTGNGPQTCFQGSSGAPTSVIGGQPFVPSPATTGSVLPTGPFKGWQYWQASIAMQLAICVVAVLVSALLLPPVRRLRFLRRLKPGTV